jgi:hypothetical protein
MPCFGIKTTQILSEAFFDEMDNKEVIHGDNVERFNENGRKYR